MFALVDCDAFFVSCERVFRPDLEKEPVIVLSSNDGCAIARSAEAKALGILMGAPYFKIQEIVRDHDVKVFSSNFSLYGDMSARVVETLKNFSTLIEVYSIDEAFLDLSSILPKDLKNYGHHIFKTVRRWTGIPVSVGIAPTKTLAKVASEFAKRDPFKCCVLNTPFEIERALKAFPVEDVWGVGRKWGQRLKQHNIHQAWDLANCPTSYLKKHYNVIMARTGLELKGLSCLEIEEVSPSKKSIVSSRSFGSPIASKDIISEALAHHGGRIAYKLRQQKSVAAHLYIFLKTNRFSKSVPYTSLSQHIPLPFPTHDTSLILKAIQKGLLEIFTDGLSFSKSGVMALGITHENDMVRDLFSFEKDTHAQNREKLFLTLDQLNRRFGRSTLKFASEGTRKTSWHPKTLLISPLYTQRWDQLRMVI